MNDLETKLKQNLNRSVDAQLGARRTPPPFQPPLVHALSGSPAPRPGRRGIRPWLAPVAAAACVVAVVAGTVGATKLLSQRHAAPPASPGTTTAPGPSGSAATSDSASPPVTGSNLPLTLTKVGSVEVALPTNWVVGDWSQYQHTNSGLGTPVWCLTPSSAPVVHHACPVELSEPGSTSYQLDSSFPGGRPGWEFCGPGGSRGGSVVLDRTMFGYRTADHVLFEEDCADGRKFHQEQYMLPFGPTVILYAGAATPELSAGMSFIALHSRAPLRTTVLPLYYEGSVRAVTATAAGHRITIDGIRYPGTGVPNDLQPASLTVDIDIQVSGSKLVVGMDLRVLTDGSKVTRADVLN